MSLVEHAAHAPNKPAYVDADTGAQLCFGELDRSSTDLSKFLRKHLSHGMRVALLMENGAGYFTVSWACRRSGLRFVPVNWHLTAQEAQYIVTNSDAKVLVASPSLAELATCLAEAVPDLDLRISDGEAFDGFDALRDAFASGAGEAPVAEVEGNYMFYSSGTTGQPKGILRPLADKPFGTRSPIEDMLSGLFEIDAETVYYTPAPLYHAAPLGWSLGVQMLGGTVVIPKRFDPEATLACIERYRVTHAQFVPTHFVRMLKLPAEVRTKYDLSSLKMVIHAAAPCPVDVKLRMFEWLGPIIHEYYSSSEGGGFTYARPDEWMARRGTVGRSVGAPVHILDDKGRELPAGETGHIAFEAPEPFEYHKEPAKTAEYFDSRGWSRPGDMGWLDEDGYLFLADRSTNMIISGGVNIYPQEIEAVLALMAPIQDVAVIGVPDAEMGEQVKAVVELAPGYQASDDLAGEIIEWCRARLAHFKCPRSVDFIASLPRLPTGKLLKRELRKRYWSEAPNQIVQSG